MASKEQETSVVSLVQQLKAGKLTKEELYESLSRMRSSSQGLHATDPGRSSAGISGRIGVEVREEAKSCELDEELVRRAKLRYGSSASEDAVEPHRSRVKLDLEEHGEDLGTSASLLDASAKTAEGHAMDRLVACSPARPASAPPGELNGVHLANQLEATATARRSALLKHAGLHSPALRAKKTSGVKAVTLSSRGPDPKTLARRRMIEEERTRVCTFQPQLYQSSSTQYLQSAGGGHKDIYQRQLAWQRRKEDAIESRRLELEKEKEMDCTFRPMTSHRNDSLLGELGGLSSSGMLNEEGVVRRLYGYGVEQKKQRQSQLRERLNQEIRRICTFKPQVNPSGRRDPTPVRSRYLDITPRKNVSMEESQLMREEKELLQCTFKPRVNKPSSDMQVAKEYLSEPAWLRLSRPRPVSPQVSVDSSADTTKDREGRPRPASAPKSRPNTSVSSESSFDAFLERQEQFVRKMELHMEQKRQEACPSHTRSLLSERSKRLIDKKRKKDPAMAGSFLDRLEAMVEKRERAHKERQSKAEEEHSFKPKINRVSRELRGRSWHEMSYGDMTRQGEAQLTVRRDVEYRNTSLYTYRPQLNALPGVESRLKISSDPLNYLARVEHEQRRAQQEQSRTAQELREKELEECTFQPLIHEAPEFVKRIAQTHKRKKMVEAMRKQASIENVHPDWNSSVAVEEKKKVTVGVRRANSFA